MAGAQPGLCKPEGGGAGGKCGQRKGGGSKKAEEWEVTHRSLDRSLRLESWLPSLELLLRGLEG